MQVEESFSRIKRPAYLNFALGLLMIFLASRSGEANFIPPIVGYIFGALAMIYAVWQYLTPYVVLSKDQIKVNGVLFAISTVKISELENILLEENEIELVRREGKNIVISLSLMPDEEGKKLYEIMKKTKDKF